MMVFNRTELRVYIIRNFRSRKAFCNKLGLVYGTFTNWFTYAKKLPLVERVLTEHFKKSDYYEKHLILGE